MDAITFSTPIFAQQAWRAVVDNLVGALLKKKACWAVSRYDRHSASRDRRRHLQMASKLRSHTPAGGYPTDVYIEMLATAGVQDRREKTRAYIGHEKRALFGNWSEIMECETGKKLHEKETAATEAVGRYSRSLKGVAPAPEHRKEMDRLQGELAKAGVDYSQHKEQCVVCRRG